MAKGKNGSRTSRVEGKPGRRLAPTPKSPPRARTAHDETIGNTPWRAGLVTEAALVQTEDAATSKGNALPDFQESLKIEEFAQAPVENGQVDAWFAEYGTVVSRVLAADETQRRMVEETVRGRDDRTQVTNTAVTPYCQICSLIILAANGSSWVGTGWLTGPRTLITAGHCVYMRRQGGWVRSVAVIPGRNGNSEPFGRTVATQFRSVSGWVNDGRPESDYGAILLDDPIGDEVGTFSYEACSDQKLSNMLINVVGYPADKQPRGFMWGHARSLGSVTAEQLFYMNDTYGGQSGAPVIFWDMSSYTVVGIHNYGDLAGNVATRITEGVLDNIRNWSA